mmetsp:Transcript_9396/g.10826  ORF Transcript_9396/g.10826 Transcript_9396/m.10826 type:complete len:90 (-) Transcript_9396:26-295(-)
MGPHESLNAAHGLCQQNITFLDRSFLDKGESPCSKHHNFYVLGQMVLNRTKLLVLFATTLNISCSLSRCARKVVRERKASSKSISLPCK